MKKIIGIDPGLQKTGWGIIESEGSSLRYVVSGLIKTNPQDGLPQRLAHLHDELIKVLELHKPDMASVEETFVNRNPASALKLGQARGVVLAVPAIYGIGVVEYSANKIKKSITGTGHAAKGQMGMMIKVLLPTCGEISEDEADALAAAITGAHYGGLERQRTLED